MLPAQQSNCCLVALLAEGVDRNEEKVNAYRENKRVALLAEGVDRNTSRILPISAAVVALLAEGVDRNFLQSL